MSIGDPITLSRDCNVVEIPSGTRDTLSAGTVVRLVQSLGGGHTVTDQRGRLYRIDGADADALRMKPAELAPPAGGPGELTEKMVWDQLRTVYDPEIPVNLVDLGLIYSCTITQTETGNYRIDVKMSMTAPGCGMANVLKADVESKLVRLPRVAHVQVEVVFDPPWTPSRMSEAARLQLGFDVDTPRYSPGPR